jgi:Fic family protein
VINTESIEITLEMLALTGEVDEFKGAWRSLSALAPERMNAVRRIATIESIGSSTRIEGSKLTDREVERLLANLDVERFSSRDEQEVAGYAEVMETVFRNWSEIPLTENHLKQLHRDLLRLLVLLVRVLRKEGVQVEVDYARHGAGRASVSGDQTTARPARAHSGGRPPRRPQVCGRPGSARESVR